MKVLDKGPHRKSMDPSVQEEIAKTYFRPASPKKEGHDKTKRREAHMPAKDATTSDTSSKKSASKLPWIIILAAAILYAAIFYAKSNIDIRVRMLRELPQTEIAGKAAISNEPKEKGLVLLDGPSVDGDLVRDAYFAGDAKAFSRTADSELVLCNSKGAGWANYTIELKDPIDLRKMNLRYIAKGARGGESVDVVIVDAANRTYRVESDVLGKLTNEWQSYKIEPSSIKKAIDLSRISIIRFEFGSLTAHNSTAAVIFLKGVYVTKTKRTIWL